jgi:signal transduction histidine kinase
MLGRKGRFRKSGKLAFVAISEACEATMMENPNHVAEPASSTTLRLTSLLLIFLTILALAAVAYFTERGIVRSRDGVVHTYQVRSQLNDLQLEVTRAESDETRYLLAGEKAELPRFRQESELALQTVEALGRLTKDNVHEQERLGQLTKILGAGPSLIHGQPQEQQNELAAQSSPGILKREDEINDRHKRIDSLVRNMQDEEETLLDQRLRSWDYLFKRNVFMLGLTFAIVTLMLAYNVGLLMSEVTRTKIKEKKVRDNAQSYRLMSAKILELQDSERRRIARELHDSVGQYLAGLKINLSQLEAGVRGDAPKMIRETIELTDYAIQEVRTISHLLHPPLLEELGFLPAAHWYIDEYGKRSQVKVSLFVDETIKRLPRDVEIALFRVLQETLTNVYRHAAAQCVDVRILRQQGYVSLIVADDGKGIPHEVLARFREGAASGIGLAGMRERLAEFGGEIRVESSSGGSVVQALIPINASAASQNAAA